jgi:N-glycosylase/DNA lyase
MELELNLRVTPFDLENTLECGQLFRWEKIDDWWYGIADGVVVKVQQKDGVLNFEGVDLSFIRDYFRLEDDLPFIISAVSRDALIEQAVQASPGLRLVRQNPWECLISYVCATYKNIPAIKSMIHKLSKRFGQKLAYENRSFYAFPEPRTLAGASLDELRSCGLGYRAKFIRQVAKRAASNNIDFERLKEAGYEEARATLQRLPGVGNKVADCVLLFALDKLEAFPVDVWMKRVILKHYAERFEDCFVISACGKTSVSQKEYGTLSSFARNYFGEYAGYAQEYLYYFIRCKMEL